ncbi:MAG: YbaN family protein [Mariprofundaceae bacterium]|nr:YbaN family protein [Mariprofundaceae bacterium]
MNNRHDTANKQYNGSEKYRADGSVELTGQVEAPANASLQFKGSTLGPGMRMVLVVLGSLFVVLGIIGIALPLVPTTPFLLLAAVCYAKSSEKCYNWLFNHKWFGEYLRNYRDGKGIQLKVKVTMLIFLWLTMSLSAGFIIDIQWVQIMLIGIATAVTAQMCYLPTFKPESEPFEEKQDRRTSG